MSGFNAPSVDVHQFAMVPRADIPRSAFRVQNNHKTTFDAGYLVPVMCEEVLPGDSFRVKMTGFARLATPINPIMDNLHLDSFFFFVPNRLVWSNWKKFMGEQNNPADSISFTVPTIAVGSSAVGSIYDYFGLPVNGQGLSVAVPCNALPLRGYNLIWNDWFRDENLQDSVTVSTGDGPDGAVYNLKRRGKRYDYFTGCLPWPQKGGTSVSLPLGTSAPVFGTGKALGLTDGTTSFGMAAVTGTAPNPQMSAFTGSLNANAGAAPSGTVLAANKSVGVVTSGVSGLFADLSAATAATINQIRQAFQIQRLLERDARGGTRYVELIKAHFGVISPDFRLQRSEYLGGGTSGLTITPVVQTSASNITGGSTPLANLSAFGTLVARDHGFSRAFTEHGYVIGLVSVRADLSYQQGIRRHWSRRTRYDYYFPAFANLGEQAVLNKEIYVKGDANDDLVFGYQERWAEYRHSPSLVTGLFRSYVAGTLDNWHLSQNFTSLPVLGDTFIQDTPPLSRVLAVGAGANGRQLIADFFFDMTMARPMPLYSVPGLIDHF